MFRQEKTSDLWRASKEGDEDTLQRILLDVAATVNVCENDATPLWIAAKNGHAGVVQTLLQVDGIEIDWTNSTGDSALVAAASNGHATTVAHLLSCANVNLANEDGATPLYMASENGHVAVVHLLVTRSDVNLTTQNGATALHIACERGHVPIVQALLPHSNPRLVDQDGWNALHTAAYSGHGGIVRVLVDSGGWGLATLTNGGDTALALAVDEGHADVATLLRSLQGCDTPLSSPSAIPPASDVPRLWLLVPSPAAAFTGVYPRGTRLAAMPMQLLLQGQPASCGDPPTWTTAAGSPHVRLLLPLLRVSLVWMQVSGLLAAHGLVDDLLVEATPYAAAVQCVAALTSLHGTPEVDHPLETALTPLAAQLSDPSMLDDQLAKTFTDFQAAMREHGKLTAWVHAADAIGLDKLG
ncbi:Aste57867_12298 [Aphanomyces stellatus]|uniref:Aste57867_12298 protein n=1 Tax=Aphanomyces stellatus TaxID=120398 RepID=A0A485KV84_9STRA|nr:hypothetical protein As57867_012252 [Aphanomyces stellatus]VFT89151.1 Aste57867_12298 [Aphanomyces stellatus]